MDATNQHGHAMRERLSMAIRLQCLRKRGSARKLLMVSAAAEFLLGSLHGLREGLCPECAAKMMGCERDEMVKATKELILDGSVLAENAVCASCRCVGPVARLRQPRF